MADPNVENHVDQAEVAWMMIGNGLASGSNNTSRITTAIDQAFAQSPYLKLN